MDEHAVTLAVGVGTVLFGTATQVLILIAGFRERRAGAFDKETSSYGRLYDDLKEHNEWLRDKLQECLEKVGVDTDKVEVSVNSEMVSVAVRTDGEQTSGD